MARILIADDDSGSLKLLDFRLKSVGHETILAADGGKALELATKEDPDLILLDVMMPVMDGFQVLRKLKAREETKNIPVIMLTSKAQEKDVVSGREGGATDYVTKPFSFAELNARVNRALASRRQN
jgi:two-component system response regulator VicR